MLRPKPVLIPSRTSHQGLSPQIPTKGRRKHRPSSHTALILACIWARATMIPSSMRRVAATTTSACGLTSALSSTVVPKATAAASAPFIGRGHQRRASSSKPSRSDNGSSDIPANQSVAASASAQGQGKTGSEKRKRKSSDRDASTKKLPSVPNTHHMVGEGSLRRHLCSDPYIIHYSLRWPGHYPV
jgi:hypothetical protein